jgi:trigger factor
MFLAYIPAVFREGDLVKSEVEVLDGLARKVKIEVPMDQVEAAFAKAYQDLRKTASIKGFRKGKAPLNVIAKMYKEKVTPDVLQKLVQVGYVTALDTHNLNPISYPNIQYDDFRPDTGFFFSAQFEIRPEVELRKIDGLQVKKELAAIPSEKIDEIINKIRENRAELTPVLEDRGVQYGDMVTLDFAGSVDSQPLEGGQAEDYQLEIGSNQFIPGFEDGLVNAKVGEEKTLHLSFPQDYQATHLSGKAVDFKVKIKKIEKKELPILDDAFVASLGGAIKTVAELRKQIEEDIQKSEAKRIFDDLKNRLLKVLVAENPVQVPLSLLEEQKKSLIDDVEKRMKEQGMGQQDFEDYRQKWDSDFIATARQMIQSSFLIDAIAQANSLSSNDNDVEQKLSEYAAEAGLELDRLKQFYKDPKHLDRLSYQLTEEKVINFLLERSKILEVPADQLESE